MCRHLHRQLQSWKILEHHRLRVDVTFFASNVTHARTVLDLHTLLANADHRPVQFLVAGNPPPPTRTHVVPHKKLT
jgi:succinylglutamate desuccinylase